LRIDKTRILITGYKGYIGNHIIKSKEFDTVDFIFFQGDVREISNWERYQNESLDFIFHAGSPAANLDEYTETYIKESILKGTRNAIALSNFTGSTLVNFSTRGIYNSKNIYEKTKKISYVETINTCDKFINLIIPRVYSKDRKKGLIPKLNTIPKKDMHRNIQYITITHFLKRLKDGIKNDNDYILFFPFRENTIEELKEIF